MAIRWIGNENGAIPTDHTITVSSLTLLVNSVFYFSSGVPTAGANGSAIHGLLQIAVAAADTTAHYIRLKAGDILEGDYTGATTNLKIGDYVDLSDSVTFNAADETIGTDGMLEVLKIDTTAAKLQVRFHAKG